MADAGTLYLESELWYRGQVDYLLRPGQSKLDRQIREWKAENPDLLGPIVVNAHRAFGKSFYLVLKCIERCLQLPGQEVRFGAPTFKQTEEIVRPLIRQILLHCPPDLQPEKSGPRLVFHNPRWGESAAPSTLHLVSCKDEADRQRGLRSDLIALDECRDIPNFPYVAGDVFGFHFATRKCPLFLLSSTPPPTPDHPFKTKYVDSARPEGRYFCMPTTEDPSWTEADDRMLAAIVGGKDTSAWRREALCEFIGDESKLILPEFQNHRDFIVVENWPRPTHFTPYSCFDTGWVDQTAMLYGFVDFENQVLVVEHEIILKKPNTFDLAAKIIETERTFYADTPHPIRRFADITPQQLADLQRDIRKLAGPEYPFTMSPVAKYDAPAAIARLRTGIQQHMIRIDARCVRLIDQCLTGIKDEQGKFERSEEHGHYDAIAALNYLYRMVNFGNNPFPDKRVGGPNIFIPPLRYPEKATRKSILITHRPLAVTRRAI